MSSAIYALKMLLLQTQLDVNAKIPIELLGYFVAKHWFKAPEGAYAAANDLQLYKLLAHERIPSFKDISDAALLALKRHLWYLNEELI